MNTAPRLWYLNPRFFIGSMVVAAFIADTLLGYLLWLTHRHLSVMQVFLLLCFLPLFFNNAWMFWHAIYYRFLKAGIIFRKNH